MFEDFANVWTPAAYSSQVRRDRPLQVRIAGTRLVLFRDAAGAPAALVDRCPHRGVALSLGRVERGCLQCPFHGWTFDRGGRCVRVPWNPDAKRADLGALAIAARELAGHVWIYTGAGAQPKEEPSVHDSLLAEDARLTGIEMSWKTHWTRAMENMLDWPHLPFVHRATIGSDLVPLTEEHMDIVMEDHPWGWRVRNVLNGIPRPGMLDFRWPNQMNLHIPMRRRSLTLAVACVPVDARHTRLLLVAARNFATWPLFDYFFNRTNRRIAHEDRAIVESSEPAETPPAGAELSVRTDAPTLRFRRGYFAHLKGSSSEPPQRQRGLTSAAGRTTSGPLP
jgi:phenylpropionate dioxygenase-like ring-hydroxylating dioxygenase large terminal subunit